MLIGISGKIDSGKDTFALLLIKAILTIKYPDAIGHKNITTPHSNVDGIQIVKFADALKDIVCRLTGCTRQQLEDQDFKNSVMPEMWGKLKWNDPDPIKGNNYTVYTREDYGDTSLITYNNGMSESEVFNHELVNVIPTYRQFLQELGTDVLRNWIPNIHVNATFAAWKPLQDTVSKISGWGRNKGELNVTPKYPKWIITDMRFPNELSAVKERGGITIRINRKQTGELSTHPSETALDDYQFFDETIDNNGTLEELYNKALEIVNKYKLHDQ